VSLMTDTPHGLMDATSARDDERFLGHLAAEVIWRIDRTAEAARCLFVEGYEEYLDMRSGERIAHPYMGILEFRADGKIAKRRDYFEMNNRLK